MRSDACSTARSTGGCCATKRRTLARFDGVLAVSDADRETFARLYPGAIAQPVHVVPTGVDTDYFAPVSRAASSLGTLVFTGSMDWLPNEDAMLYFCRDVLPLIRAEEPGRRADRSSAARRRRR